MIKDSYIWFALKLLVKNPILFIKWFLVEIQTYRRERWYKRVLYPFLEHHGNLGKGD